MTLRSSPPRSLVRAKSTVTAHITGCDCYGRRLQRWCRSEPFIPDGNKRTGFVVGVLSLEINGYTFTAREETATQAILSLASGTLAEEV